MAKRRSAAAVLALLVALLLVGGGASWWFATSSSSEDEDAPSSRRAATKPAAPRRSRATVESSPSATSPPPTKPKDDDADWAARLRRLLDGDASITAKSIVAAAGKGRPPGDGLNQILRRGADDLASATTDRERRRAQDIVDWVIDQALTPYRQDRAKFAPLYRRVRFGAGDLGAAGGSPVRELNFDEAAKEIEALRPELWTWCYDALAIRAAATFRNDTLWWDWYGRYCAWRKWDAPPAAGSNVAKTMSPTTLFATYVRPHLADFPYSPAMGMGKLFVDLGELDAATECLARARQSLAASPFADARATTAPFLDELDVEIAAFRELRSLTALRLPAAAADDPSVARWFAKRRTTDVAHAIGVDGPIEIGPWDDAMTASFLEGGLPWAPEQWEVERARRDAAKTDTIDGIRGVTVKSPMWDVFSDVSAEFAAQTTLVLEAGFAQAQAGLGIAANPVKRLGARIYAHRAAYQQVTRDFSGGEWIPKLNAVLSFVDDPLHDDFEEFRWPTLVHEATHAALSWSVGNVPAWMNEGLACYVQRWMPTWSMSANWGSTKDWVRRKRTLEAARDEKRLPTLDELLAITTKLDADNMGPITAARYAAAESFFVYLAADDARWKLVGDWLAACRNKKDPTATITAEQRADFAKGWAETIDFICGRMESK